MTESEWWIRDLKLRRHPEGGWFREIYRSEETIPRRSLPVRFGGSRTYSTAIYFLLDGSEFSALHRLRQDELWHFYEGHALTIHTLDPEGRHTIGVLGRRVDAGESLVVVVSAGHWVGAVVEPGRYALVGCTVAPGFEFKDFEMPDRDELQGRFPEHRAIIERLTR
jgi:predicted cupin superfamily sugar epimerase